MRLWRFNVYCLFFSFIFALGIAWLWYPSLAQMKYVSDEEFDAIRSSSQLGQTRGQNRPQVLDEPERGTLESANGPDSLNSNIPEVDKPDEIDTSDEIIENKKEIEDEVPTAYKEESLAHNELQGVIEHVLVNLDVPFTSQAPEKNWEEPWQDACEEAAVLMLEAYYKNYGVSPLFAKDEILKMINWEEKRGWGTSIPIRDIKVLFETFITINKTPKLIENPSISDIKTFLDKGMPVLAVADGTELPNKWYSGDGPDYHALIVRGYTSDGTFITNDPGVNRGRNFTFPAEDFMRALHDWNGGDVKHGAKVILVLE